MTALLEIVARALLEVLAYGTGKVFAQALVPHLGIEPFERQQSTPAWKWRGLTYAKGNRRFLYTESIQLLGLGVWLIVGLLVFAGLRWGPANAV